MRQYVDSCLTYEILLQDSGLAPKPSDDWITFEPREGDYAHVDENDLDYVFHDGQWTETEKEKENYGYDQLG